MNPKSCIHYSYVGGEGPRCALGIPVSTRFRPLWPCIAGNNPKEASETCQKFEAPTREQLEQSARETDEAVARAFQAVVAIEQWEKVHGQVMGRVVRISCPCCLIEDALRYHRDRYHLTAQCETPKCVQFRGSTRR